MNINIPLARCNIDTKPARGNRYPVASISRMTPKRGLLFPTSDIYNPFVNKAFKKTLSSFADFCFFANQKLRLNVKSCVLKNGS
jgi:hypothetical protein